jgi:hypothetical protein
MVFSNIEEVVTNFTGKAIPEHRFSSFDYCYNYFLNTDDLTKNMEKSCLELGFYLASWGMFRGSSFLLQKSARHFIPTIEYINTLDKTVWQIDVNKYDVNNIDIILDIYNKIDRTIIEGWNRGITLTTKIILGVFGFMPAFDEYVCSAFRNIADGKNGNPKCGFRSVNKDSLRIIKQFYDENKVAIDKLSNNIYTKDFSTGKITKINYPKAKIIDMFGFTYGQSL